MKIGILVTATWRFIDFFPRLMQSLAHFCPGHEKQVFLFTDHWDHFDGTTTILIPHVPFPHITLERYHRYVEYRHLYEDCDYVFHFDADMQVIQAGDEMLKPLVAVRHPLFYGGGGSWETRPASTAFVPEDLRQGYYCGGIQGGTPAHYLGMASILAERIDQDRQNGILAEWHDESHWNWFLANHPNVFDELDAGYCYPEEKTIPFDKKIMALNKDRGKYRQ